MIMKQKSTQTKQKLKFLKIDEKFYELNEKKSRKKIESVCGLSAFFNAFCCVVELIFKHIEQIESIYDDA